MIEHTGAGRCVDAEDANMLSESILAIAKDSAVDAKPSYEVFHTLFLQSQNVRQYANTITDKNQ